MQKVRFFLLLAIWATVVFSSCKKNTEESTVPTCLLKTMQTPYDKVDYVYNSQGERVQHTYFQGANKGMEHFYTYNASGKLETEFIKVYNYTTGALKSEILITFEYAGSNLVKLTRKTTSIASGAVQEYSFEYLYNSSGHKIKETLFVKQGGSWVLNRVSNFTYTYNSSGKILTETGEDYSQINTYNSENKLTNRERLFRSFDNDRQDMQDFKTLETFDEKEQVLLYKLYWKKDGVFVMTEERENIYTYSGDLLSILFRKFKFYRDRDFISTTPLNTIEYPTDYIYECE